MKPANSSKPDIETLLFEITQLKSRARMEKRLKSHPCLMQLDVVIRLAQLVVETIRKDTSLALRFAECGLVIARNLKNREASATAWRAKANALYGVGDNRAAVQHHRKAIKTFLSLNKKKEAARALSGSIQPLILLGKYEAAIVASERARQIYLEMGEDWRLARLAINVGNIYHRQDRFEEALQRYEEAYQGLLRHQDAEALGIVLSNIAVSLVSLNDFDRARTSYEKARLVCEQNGMPLLVAQVDYNIANLYYLRGEYSRALDSLYAVKRVFETTGDHYHVALCYLDLSEIHLELNMSEDAEKMAHEAFARFEKLKMGYEAAKSIAIEAIASGQQGKCADSLRKFRKAGKRFVVEKNQVWPRTLELYQAVVLFQEGRHGDARRFCIGVASFFDRNTMFAKAALAHLLLARIAFHDQEFENAWRHAQGALDRLKKFPSSDVACQAVFLQGQLAESRNDGRAAYSRYREACERLENLRSQVRGEDLKISFMKNRLEVYEKLVSLCLTEKKGEEGQTAAFGYIQAAKSRNISEFISDGQDGLLLSRHDEQAELSQDIVKMRQELNWYYHRIENEQFTAKEFSQKRVDRLRQKAQLLENQFARRLRELPQAAGAARKHVPADCRVREIQRSLGGDSTLLEYFCLGSQLVVAVVTSDGLRVVRLSQLGRVQELLRQLQFQLGKFRYLDRRPLQTDQSMILATQSGLASLYDELVAPVAPFITTEHLVIAPHGPLHYLPFHALRREGHYMCETLSISYAPSATVFAQCQQIASRKISSSLILGVPDENAPQIEKEVRAIAGIVSNPTLHIGQEAGTDILREEGARCDLIHISTHGNFRQDNPMFSSLRLGDGPLNLYDLYQMRFDSTLVTLSGCSTGMNVVAAGDELLGLQRGLLHAGARSMLLSLWDVNDESTAELMVEFYSRLMNSSRPAESLRQAMQEIRERYPHPYYWAPFILVGRHAVS